MIRVAAGYLGPLLATREQQDEARRLRLEIADEMPGALRGPLLAVEAGIEARGVADEVLRLARAYADIVRVLSPREQ